MPLSNVPVDEQDKVTVDPATQAPVATQETVDEAPVAPVVPGQVVTPEQTVAPADVVPASFDDYPEHGAVAHDTNDAPELIEASNDESNNPTVQGKVKRDKSLDRKKGETQAEYNERVAPGNQPVQPAPTHSYLGAKL
jgi:hypothetical protein